MDDAPEEWTVLSMMEWATSWFKTQKVPDSRHSIEWLLSETLGVKRLDLYLMYDRPLTRDELDELRPLVKRRANHEPLQYITGFTEFMNAKITVTPDVLIPRIETEQLTELILDREDAGARLRGLDIGTGSGCIPVALAMERPEWTLHAFDLSAEALEVARGNAEANEVDVYYQQGDLLRWRELELDGPFDFIVSNPPYIPPSEKETLEPQVRSWEPSLALFCEDPREIYRAIRECASAHLENDGRLYLEIHEGHSDEILEIFDRNGWSSSLLKDYDKKPRFVVAQKNLPQ